MRLSLVSLLVLGVLVGSLAAADQNPELARFQGDWEVTDLVENGKVIPKEAIREWLPSGGKVKISQNAILFTSPHDHKSHAKVFTIQATQYPKGIDVTSRDGESSQGIYRFDDTRLIVCFAGPGAPRPTDFSSVDGSKRMLMVLGRPAVAQQTAASEPVASTQPPTVPTAQPQNQAQPQAKVLDDETARKMLVGTWQLNDGLGQIFVTINPDGTFLTTRDVAEIQLFQTVFARKPISSGTWKVEKGQLFYNVASSAYPDRQGRTFPLTIRTISTKDLVFADLLGRVGTAVKSQ